jgi:heat shock protein HslJ
MWQIIKKSLAALNVLLVAALMALPALAEDELSGGQWQLVSIDGQPVVAGSLVTLTFDNDGNLFGNGGCNSYSGTYTIEGDKIIMGPIISTLMMCTDAAVADQEAAYFGALQQVVTRAVVDGQLLLMTEAGVELNFVRRAGLEGTQWQMTSLNSQQAIGDVWLSFANDGTLGGFAGCNRFTGGYDARGDALTVGALVSTEVACLDEAITAQEDAFLAALASAFAYSKQGEELIISTPQGGIILLEIKNLAGTQWTLVALGEAPALDDSTLTLSFSADGRVSGDSGCNRFMGSYEADGPRLTLSQLASTRRACLNDALNQQEQAYLQALQSIVRYQANYGQLVLTTEDGLALTFSPATPIIGTEWTLVSLNGADVTGSAPTLTLNEDGSLGGSGGCNRYGGSYTLADGKLSVSALFSTMMACAEPIMRQETAFLNALEAATVARVEGSQLILEGENIRLVFES